MGWQVTAMPGVVRTHHGKCNFQCSLPGGVLMHHGLFRACAFETPATFHIVAKSHWAVQWFIQPSQKTIPSPLLTNIDVTPSIPDPGIHKPSSHTIMEGGKETILWCLEPCTLHLAPPSSTPGFKFTKCIDPQVHWAAEYT